jgi:DNA-binding XRE family transcriptional regulator
MQSVIQVRLHANLRAEMARHGVTEQDLAALLEVHRATIRNKLAGRSEWSVNEADTIAQHFNMTIQYLFIDS